MKTVTVDFSKETGRMKPMHASNNGPVFSVRGTGNFDAFVEAGIPYMRNHDAAFLAGYGGSHTVDVLNIFQDFDADENDTANYDFTLTDQYTETCQKTGGKVFYRLGSKIEHEIRKYQTQVPKDFAKYARICEHIIRHYTEGWDNGFTFDIEYWEIWNEPDCGTPGNNPCWQGTHEEFLRFYEVMAKHLKGCFPHLKIGGPAYTKSYEGKPEPPAFVAYMKEHDVPLDFFSYHGYKTDPQYYVDCTNYTRALLDSYGFEKTELILNEWNYVITFHGQDMIESYRTMVNHKGAAFIGACILAMQKTPLDMFMYYDFRPGAYSGPFDPFTKEIRKPYWPFWNFNKLYRLGGEVASEGTDDLYIGAAKGEGGSAVMLSYYRDQDLAEEEVEIAMKGLQGRTKFVTYVTDEEHDHAILRKDVFTGEEGSVVLTLKPHSVVLLLAEE